jgi:hypothetical protein
MTRITTTPLAVSADYHDALVTARRAKNWLFLLLLLGILAQIAVFCLARFTDVVRVRPGAEPQVKVPDVDIEKSRVAEPSSTTTTTAPVETETKRTVDVDTKVVAGGAIAWAVNCILYLGTVFSIVMAIVVLLIVLIMLVGRLIGVSHTTSAFIWAVILAVLVFPWQLFYGPETSREATATTTEHNIDLDDFRVPGVLYTWGELSQGLDFEKGFGKVAVLRYARFIGFPVVALILLFMVQAKSGRGVKYALGEAEVHVDVTTTDA